MTSYSFVTRWRAQAPIDRVFDVVGDVDGWPGWWRGVEEATLIEHAGGDTTAGVGSRYRFSFRSRLPYSLRFEMVVTQLDKPRLLTGRASGELEGTGRWRLRQVADDATDVTYEWNVRTTRWWMNLLAPVARPLFAANHDILMGWGRDGLARQLGAPVEDVQTPSGSGSSRGAPTGA